MNQTKPIKKKKRSLEEDPLRNLFTISLERKRNDARLFYKFARSSLTLSTGITCVILCDKPRGYRARTMFEVDDDLYRVIKFSRENEFRKCDKYSDANTSNCFPLEENKWIIRGNRSRRNRPFSPLLDARR